MNVAPLVLEQDLNEIPLVNDPPEVLIHPMNQLDHRQDLENFQEQVVDYWREELPAIGQQVMQDPEVPRNQQAAPLLQDLNEVPNVEDPVEVLIHPPQVLVQGQDLD